MYNLLKFESKFLYYVCNKTNVIMVGVYKYRGFYIIDNRNSNENACDNKNWYIMLKTTPIYFSSLKESRKWCKDNYLLGVFYGWTKG